MSPARPQRTREYRNHHLDSTRWDGYQPRPTDIVVGRDTRDVFMSLWNYYRGYTELAYQLMNDVDRPGPELPRCPAAPGELWARWISQGWFEWEPDGWPFWSHHHHVSTWWEVRELPNVMLVHFADLRADTETEMRRIADFCAIDVDEPAWPDLELYDRAAATLDPELRSWLEGGRHA